MRIQARRLEPLRGKHARSTLVQAGGKRLANLNGSCTVILCLPCLHNARHHHLYNLLHIGIQWHLDICAWHPSWWVAQFIECTNKCEQCCDSTFPDALIEVRCERNQLVSRFLNVRQECSTRVLEKFAKRVSRHFLFNRHSCRYIHKGVSELLHVHETVIIVIILIFTWHSESGNRTIARCSWHGVVFGLLKACQHLRHHMLQVRPKFFLEYTRHHCKEYVRTFAQTWLIHGQALNSNAHHIWQIRTESIRAHSLGKRANRVRRNTTQVNFFAFLGEQEERLDSLYQRYKVRHKSFFRSMSSTSNSTCDCGLHCYRCRVKQTSETLHDRRQVLANVIAHDLEESIKSRACRALCLWCVDQLHD